MPSEKIQSLQILRGIAATMVVASHSLFFANVLDPVAFPLVDRANLGTAGVDIFFVLSGVVIYRSAFAGRRQSAGMFLVRRLLRVAPLYYLLALLGIALATVGGPALSPENIMTAFTFWPVWHGEAWLPVETAGWTLCFEMLFYVGAACVLAWRPAIYGLLVAYPVAWLFGYFVTDTAALRFLGNPIIVEFLFGVAIAATSPNKPRPLWVGASLVGLGVVAMYLSCLPEGDDAPILVLTGSESVVRLLSWGVPAALIVKGALLLEPHLRGAWQRPLIFLGDASYSIYLVNVAALYAAFMEARVLNAASLPLGLIAPTFLAVGVAAGIAVYRFVERPISSALRAQLSAALPALQGSTE
ncbi:MAG TPA: acyltransferase [Stellaceae bacterium]|jgi:peptidoglycan/LPS O-acetylase OafA/YrhL